MSNDYRDAYKAWVAALSDDQLHKLIATLPLGWARGHARYERELRRMNTIQRVHTAA